MREVRIEGVRPRQAICERCGYQFGGAKVERGALRCPECSHETRLEFRSLEGWRRVIGVMRVVRRVVWWGVGLGLIAVIVCMGLLSARGK